MNWQFSVQLVSPKIAPFTSIKSQSTFLSIHSELALAFISSTVPNHFGLFDVDRVTPFSQQDQDKKKESPNSLNSAMWSISPINDPFARLTKIIIHAHIVEGWNIWHAVNFKDNIPVREWKKKEKSLNNQNTYCRCLMLIFYQFFIPFYLEEITQFILKTIVDHKSQFGPL